MYTYIYYTHRHTSERNGEQGNLLTCEIPWLSCPRRQRQPLQGEDRCHRRSMVQHGAAWCSMAQHGAADLWRSIAAQQISMMIYDSSMFIYAYERLSMIIYDYICMMIYDYL